MLVQQTCQSEEQLRVLEGETFHLREEKAALKQQLDDCQGRLKAAQHQLQNALTTQAAAQTHLDQLQKVLIFKIECSRIGAKSSTQSSESLSESA